MTKSVTKVSEKNFSVTISYADEGIDLTVTKKFIGDEKEADNYVQAMDRDARVNHAHLFPLPEPVIYEDEEMLI
jgi:hypothetical protein